MGTWNHRVIYSNQHGEPWYEIHEVHYNADGTVRGWTVAGKSVAGDSMANIYELLRMMLTAARRPILIEAKRRGKPTLVELRPGSKEAKGCPIDELNAQEIVNLKAFKKAIEDFIP